LKCVAGYLVDDGQNHILDHWPENQLKDVPDELITLGLHLLLEGINFRLYFSHVLCWLPIFTELDTLLLGFASFLKLVK